MKFKFLLNIISYLVIFFVSSLLIKQIDLVLIKIATILFFLGLSVFISLKFYPFDIKSFFKIELKNLAYIFIGFFTPVICFLFIISYSLFKGYLNNFSVDYDNITGNIISSFYVAITEELFMRGLIFYTILKTTKSFLFATIISSIIFTLFHSLGASLFNDYPLFVLYFTSSLIFSYLIVLSNSIIPCFVLHFTNNLINKIIDFDFGVYEKYITQTSPIIFIPYVLPFIVLLFFFFIKHRNIETIAKTI